MLMKSLLAYLFVVLGLGLVFQTKSYADRNAIPSLLNAEIEIEYTRRGKIYNEIIKSKQNITFHENYKCEAHLRSGGCSWRQKGKRIWFDFLIGKKGYKSFEGDLNEVNNVVSGKYRDSKGRSGEFKGLIFPKTFLPQLAKNEGVVKTEVKNEDVIKLEEKKKLIAEKKKKEEEKRIAEEKRLAEKKRIEEEKKKEQEYRILVKKFGDQCKNNSLGSPEFNKCLNDKKSEEELRVKLEKEYLESLNPEERRAHICSKTFGFKKGSGNFKDCVFKIYATELELAKLEVEKQLAEAQLEIAKAHREAAEARVVAAKAQGKLQKAQIQATEAQAAASQQQAAATKAQAAATKQQNSMNMFLQGLQMLQPTTTQPQSFNTTCRWMGGFFNCW